MAKKRINLTEGYLRKVIRESINRLMREEHELDKYEMADDTYTIDDLSELNALDAFYTPSDGHISVNTPEGYDDGEVEIPFRIIPVFKPDYYDWYTLESTYADAVTSDQNSIEYQQFVRYEDVINKALEKNFEYLKNNYFDDIQTP